MIYTDSTRFKEKLDSLKIHIRLINDRNINWDEREALNGILELIECLHKELQCHYHFEED